MDTAEATTDIIVPDKPDVIDAVERMMADNFPLIDLPLEHLFTPGIYVRTCHIPEGAMVTTRIHKTEHPFIILKGRVKVVSGNEGSVVYTAPYVGVTKPGTRRILHALEATTWITFHATDLTDPDAIGEEITEDHFNPLFDDPHDVRLQTWRVKKMPSLKSGEYAKMDCVGINGCKSSEESLHHKI